jgi:hypothetical protein
MAASMKEYIEEFKFSEVLKFDFSHLKGDIVGGLTSAIVALCPDSGGGVRYART